MKQDKYNPGPKDQQFNKSTAKKSNAGKTGSSKGPANMKDQQFNKKYSKRGNAGSFGDSSKGSSGMQDEQFNQGKSYNDLNDDGSTGSGGPTQVGADKQHNKSDGKQLRRGQGPNAKRPDDGMNFMSQEKKPAAHQIMTSITKALIKAPSFPNQPGQGKNQPKVGKPGDASSDSQSKSFKDTAGVGEEARPKSQKRGFITGKPKSPQSSPGSKTAAVNYKGKGKGTGSV